VTHKEDIVLRIESKDLDASRLQNITRDLAASLRKQNLGKIELPEYPVDPTMKGVPVDLGNIILTLIGSGGVVVSLIAVLKAFVERKRTLVFKFCRQDGKKIELNAENLSEGQLEKTLQTVEQFLKE
jgi:hypothetical protein